MLTGVCLEERLMLKDVPKLEKNNSTLKVFVLHEKQTCLLVFLPLQHTRNVPKVED